MPRDSRARSRSAKPDRPPRRATIRHCSARTTTCTPWRRSHLRSSKPSFGPRGSRTSPTRSRMAPWGGERPGGRRSSTGSRITSSPNRRICPGTRRSNGERRAGPVTATSARSAVPTRGSNGLWSRASRRALPHHHPASASATPRAGSRHAGERRIDVAIAPIAAVATASDALRVKFAPASPTQRQAASRCGRARSRRFTAPPRRAAARSGRGRCPEWRRAPRGS
jgi:hypothetical protein